MCKSIQLGAMANTNNQPQSIWNLIKPSDLLLTMSTRVCEQPTYARQLTRLLIASIDALTKRHALLVLFRFTISYYRNKMARLEELQPETVVRGILPDASVSVVNVEWHGSDALTLVYRGPNGRVADEILYRHDEPRLEIAEAGRPWSFDGDGALFRLVSEAHRIRLAHLFDPVLAVHTSLVEPLPHQITAVYEAMLPRQPLRFLLADDPGAGKTIMAGLLIKELLARGDL
jgi:hypothetical protein